MVSSTAATILVLSTRDPTATMTGVIIGLVAFAVLAGVVCFLKKRRRK